jgi:ATP-dependent Clp protease protease subunit
VGDLFLNYQAPINEPSINNLHTLLTIVLTRPAPPTSITVLMNSLGGQVHAGVASYSFIKALPAPINFINVGNVDSIASIVFLAGAKRIAVPSATFYLHSSNRTFNGPQGIAAVEEALSSLRSDNERMATIIAQETLIEKTDISGIFLHGRTMNADEAKTHGLIHEIRALAMPSGSEVMQVAAAY